MSNLNNTNNTNNTNNNNTNNTNNSKKWYRKRNNNRSNPNYYDNRLNQNNYSNRLNPNNFNYYDRADQMASNRYYPNNRYNPINNNYNLNNLNNLNKSIKNNKPSELVNNIKSNSEQIENSELDLMLFNSIQKIINEMDSSNGSPIIKNITIKKISKNCDNKTCETNIYDSNKTNKKVEQKEEEEFILDISKEYDDLDVSLNSLDSLIQLGKKYNPTTAHKYAINLKRLNLLVPTLEKLQNTIGMDNVKTSIVNQIIYFLSAFESNDNMLHTVITGPPGVGKTMLGQIIGEIYYNLGIIKGQRTKESTNLSDDISSPVYPFKIARRSDLIGQYLGQTALKTQKVIDECEGGVLFIDEAYSLGSGSSDKSDIYSKECLDTINLNLTEKKKNFVCIIAGYPECLDKDFFSVNPGLKRRFPFTYNIEKYSADELGNIFQLMMIQNTWCFESDNILKNFKTFLSKNYDSFPNFGGDMETLFFNVKIAHALRVVGKHPSNRKKVSMLDIENGFKFYKLAKVKKDTSVMPTHLFGLYS